MPTKSQEARSNEARVRADASFRKEERAKDSAKAMTEYLDNARLVRERTERLRALRLAKEAADKKAAENTATDKKAASFNKVAVASRPATRKRSAAKVAAKV